MKESGFPLDQQLLVILGVAWGAGEGEAAGLSLYDAHLGNTCDLNILMFWWGWLSGEARIPRGISALCRKSLSNPATIPGVPQDTLGLDG